jgi:hypothetical protein
LGATSKTPLVGFGDVTLDHRTIRFQTLPDRMKAKLVQTAERREVSGIEDSVEQVEVFPMGSVGPSIVGRSRFLPTPTRPTHHMHLVREEPAGP